MADEMTFGNWLKRRRRQLDLTQKELARRASCSLGTIRKLESGTRQPSKQLARIIAVQLDIPPPQQSAFIAFARSEAYTAEMAAASSGLGGDLPESALLSAAPTVWPKTSPAIQASTIKHNLPSQPTPFIGREAELAALDDLMDDPDIRLVTIVGAGGMGKTRLALAAAERQLTRTVPRAMLAGNKPVPIFPDGIIFVSLAGLSAVGYMVSTIAQALNFRFRPGGPEAPSPRQQLLHNLRQKRLLLVMDNFEHLLDGAALVADILLAATAVHVLVTSRERLHLRAEQVFQIEGLDFPQWESVDDANVYSAVQLFLRSARRNQYDFALQGNDGRTALARICRLVAGMPLAIELAASWVDTLSLGDIASELEQGLDLLETSLRDVPEHHRSVRAAFDHSWQRLNEQERDIFAKLSVFRGGFTRQAAQIITGVSRLALARLLSKSLVQYDKASDRYQVHELLRQYGAEKLANNNAQKKIVCNHTSVFFCEALHQWDADIKGPGWEMALAQIEADEDNIREAWHWAIVHEKWDHIDHAVNGLSRFYLERNRWFEGESVCRQAVAKQGASISSPLVNLATLAKTLVWQGNFLLLLGQGETAEKILQRGLLLLENPFLSNQEIRSVKAHALWLMAILAIRKPDLEVARQWAEQSLALYQALHDPWGTALLIGVLGQIQHQLGLRLEARQSLEKSLASFRQLGDQIKVTQAIIMLIEIKIREGQFEEAKQLCLETLATWKNLNQRMGKEHTFNTLGWIALHQGRLTEADAHFQKSLQENDGKLSYWTPDSNVGQSMIKLHRGQYEQVSPQVQLALNLIQDYGTQLYKGHVPLIHSCVALVKREYHEAQRFLEEAITVYGSLQEQHFLVDALGILGTTLVKLGRLSEARKYLHKAVKLAVESHSFKVPSPLAGVALLLVAVGQKERAVELYALAQTDPLVANSRWFADVYDRSIETAMAALPPNIAKKAKAQGRVLDLHQTADSLLTELQELGWSQPNLNKT